MKCTVCKENAFIKLVRHNSALCEMHFHEHVRRQVTRTIRRYQMFSRDSRVMVGVSGGKDSMGAWKILSDLNCHVIAVHINSGRRQSVSPMRV